MSVRKLKTMAWHSGALTGFNDDLLLPCLGCLWLRRKTNERIMSKHHPSALEWCKSCRASTPAHVFTGQYRHRFAALRVPEGRGILGCNFGHDVLDLGHELSLAAVSWLVLWHGGSESARATSATSRKPKVEESGKQVRKSEVHVHAQEAVRCRGAAHGRLLLTRVS